MPLVRMEDLPDNSRTWVFGADRDVEESSAKLLLREVDRFLSDWHAHGAPLTVARDWKYKRFLTVAVDRSTAGASGCGRCRYPPARSSSLFAASAEPMPPRRRAA